MVRRCVLTIQQSSSNRNSQQTNTHTDGPKSDLSTWNNLEFLWKRELSPSNQQKLTVKMLFGIKSKTKIKLLHSNKQKEIASSEMLSEKISLIFEFKWNDYYPLRPKTHIWFFFSRTFATVERSNMQIANGNLLHTFYHMAAVAVAVAFSTALNLLCKSA